MELTATHIVMSAPDAAIATARRDCCEGHFARAVEIRGGTVRYVQTDGIDGPDVAAREIPTASLVALETVTVPAATPNIPARGFIL
jgi:hypothetical protein